MTRMGMFAFCLLPFKRRYHGFYGLELMGRQGSRVGVVLLNRRKNGVRIMLQINKQTLTPDANDSRVEQT